MLALNANTTLSGDELIDGLWGDDPPASAAKNIQRYVSRLRKALGEGRAEAEILTRGRGYELRAGHRRGRRPALRAVGRGGRSRAGRRRGERPGRRRARALARRPARRRRLRAVRRPRDRPARGASPAGARAGDRRRARRRAPRRGDRPARGADRGGAAARAPARAADARPLSRRAPVRGPRRLPRGARDADRADRGRARAPSCKRLQAADPRPGPEPRRAAADRRAAGPARGRLAAARRARARAGLAAQALGTRRARAGSSARWSGGPPGSARRGSSPSSRPRSSARARRSSTPAAARSPRAALATVAEAGTGHRPTLLVLDYADDAPPAVLEAAAALAREPEGRALLICVLHHDEQGPPAFAALLESGAAQRLRLDPLGEDAAAEIAALYAPAEGTAMPLRTLLAESDGVPLRIHRAAGEWARAEAAERLAAAAGQAAGDRSDLRAAQAAIAGGVVELQTRRRAHPPLRGRGARRSLGARGLSLPRPGPLRRRTRRVLLRPRAPGRRARRPPGRLDPARGGRPLGERQVLGGARRPAAGARRRGRSRLRALAPGGDAPRRAPAGRALPHPRPRGARGGARGALRRGSPTRSTGSRPASAWCSSSISSRRSSSPVATATEREAFLDALVEGAADPDERLIVVLAIRADFYGRCAEHAELVDAGQRQPGPGRADAPRRAAAGDRAAGAPGRAADGAAARLGAGRRRRRRARRPAAALGRSARALAAPRRPHPSPPSLRTTPAASRARSRAWPRTPTGASATPSGAGRARCCCASPATMRQAEAFVRRRVPLDELELDRDPDAARALAVLTESRLLTVDEGAVEVAHEALLREWPRLRGWLEADAEGRRLHHHLIGAAREWRDSERDPAELYRGARLAAALDWAAEHDPELNELERDLPRREPGGERARGRAPAPRRSAACGRCSPASACCSPPPWSPG